MTRNIVSIALNVPYISYIYNVYKMFSKRDNDLVL